MRSLLVALCVAATSSFAGERYLTWDHFTSGGAVNASVVFGEYEGAGVLLQPDGGYPLVLKAIDVLCVPGQGGGTIGGYFLDVWDETNDAGISPPTNTWGNRFSASSVGYRFDATTAQFNRVTFPAPVIIDGGPIFIGVREMLSTAQDGTTIGMDTQAAAPGANWYWDPNVGWLSMPDAGARPVPSNNWIIRAVIDVPNPPPPTVTAISPNEGVEGTAVAVTITGTNFDLTSTPKLSGTPITVLSLASATRIDAEIPGGFAPGVYDVQVTNTSSAQTGTLPRGFTVRQQDGGVPDSGTGGGAGGGSGGGTGGGAGGGAGGGGGGGGLAQALALDSVDPVDAWAGEETTLTLVGAAFDPAVAVLVGKTALDQVSRKSAAVATAVLPKGFAVGTHDVTVVNPDSTRATLAQVLTVHEGLKAKPGCGCGPGPVGGVGEVAPLALLLFALRRRRR